MHKYKWFNGKGLYWIEHKVLKECISLYSAHSPQLWGTEALQTAEDLGSGSAWWSAISGRQSGTAKQTNSGSAAYV